MAQRPAKSERVTWRGDPARDFVTYQLLRLARAALAAHFADDDTEEAYAAWRQSKAVRRGGAVPPLDLASWDDTEGCAVTLTALAAENRFGLKLVDPAFIADVHATYNPVIEELEAAGVTNFSGDLHRAVEAITTRIDALLDQDALDELNIDLGDLEGFTDAGLDDDASADDASAEGAGGRGLPPPIDDADLARVERMASHLSKRFADEKAPDLTDDDRDWIERTPASLWALLDGIIDAAAAEPLDDDLVAAWGFLLSHQLELVRYRSERGYAWADAMLDAYQDRIIAYAQEGETDGDTLFLLVAALNHAKVPVRPEVGQALMDGEGDSPAASMANAEALNTMLRPMIDEFAEQLDTPFEVIESLDEATGIAPPQVRAFLPHELALSPHAVLRESVPLMLLDASSEVRRAAAAALEQVAAPDTLSAASLRRIIALRNWIPEADRAAVDQAVRKARTKGVTIAQWDTPADIATYASPIDGSGAQSLLLATRAGRTGVFCGILAKDVFGVRDVWCNKDIPRREIASGLAEMQRAVASPEVERAYFDAAIQHHIAIGLAHDHLPGAALLEIAEAAGGADWKDRRIDTVAETQRLFSELPPAERTAAAVDASLRRSGKWVLNDKLGETWFEDDAEIRDVIAGLKVRDVTAAGRLLLTGVMQGRRHAWAERCLLMTLWARAIKGGTKAPSWRDFLLLANELLGDRSLTDIPAMQYIAGRSLAAAKSSEW